MEYRASGYHAYLLRFWRERNRPPGDAWRFSLEDPHTGERQGFASLEALLAHLQAEMDDTPPPPDLPGSARQNLAGLSKK